MTKFKEWLYDRFLPAYCKEDLLKTNARLVKVVAQQKAELEIQEAYISGLERAMRTRVTIRNEVSK